jgi:septal ring factor EnvC (AmiA/AmiB activator)
MQRLANQQGQVKKSIDDLNRELKESGGTRKNIVGDLERAAREIDEVLTDMRSGQVTPETIQRQERILSRLLDATRSNRERDFDKERESRSGVDVVRQSPPELKSDPETKERTGRDQLNAREQGYTKDYEYMIRRYFEALGKGSGVTE